MSKTIKIFLASSIVELKQERISIENIIRKISYILEDKYAIRVKPLLCENFDEAYSGRKQDEYNAKIVPSDICLFIFFKKAGNFTEEEFDVASNNYQKTGRSKPIIFFKEAPENELHESIFKFKEKLADYPYSINYFDDIESLKFRILLLIKAAVLNDINIEVKNGKVLLEGETLRIKNIPEFANNSSLNRIKQEYNTKNDSEIFNNICSAEKEILDFSLAMMKKCSDSKLTEQEEKAYSFFTSGNLQGAKAALKEI